MQVEGSTSSLRHLEVSMSHSVSPDVHRLVADAIATIRSGDKARGQKLLMQALRINPHHEVAWLWMASLVETPERRRECLERALAINPNNETARRALQALSEPQPPHATPQQHVDALDQTFHSSPTSVHEHVQTATQANRTQDDQARHCLHCGAPLETTATFCAFCKSPVAPHPASDAPSLSLTNKERRRLETSKDTRNRRRPSFLEHFSSFCFFLIFAPMVFCTILSSPSLSIFLLLISAPPLILSSMELYRNYQIERSLKKATSRVDCPVLDMWKDDDSESTSYFIAWELMATDQHGQPLRLQQAQKIYGYRLYGCLMMCRTVRVRYAPEQPDVSILDEEWVAAIQKSSHV
jgi:hypothetical protein